MDDNAQFYTQFAKVLRGDTPASMAPFFTDNKSAARMAVHQGNFRLTITKAMQGTYRAVNRLVGEEYFTGLIANFIQKHPPNQASLTLYGECFPEFLRAFAPVQEELPWLAPVAQLDWAWFHAYGAANTPALDAKDLQNIAPEILPARAPGLHPSVSLLRFSVPAFSIWRTNIEDEDVQPVDMKKGREWACIWREDQRLRHTALSQAEYAFLDAIGGGRSLAEGWADARRYEVDFNLSAHFAKWLNDGIFNGEHHD